MGELSHLRRARMGQIRVLYQILEDRLLVYVTAIGPRGDVYKQ